jgi:carbon storage regulator
MLVLSRKIGETIRIGETIIMTVLRCERDRVCLGFQAPADVKIFRQEIWMRVLSEANQDEPSHGRGPERVAAGERRHEPA